ncbi:MAG: Gfo/Idh/MocA family oxidoreductase [Planctomycetota bacterium]|nr:Gfo/Idh/MocA family oxidoreductase [Planctomycetota bacterium]
MAESTGGAMGRREFLKAAAGAAATAGLAVVAPQAVRGFEANSKIQLGVIGCGGRGKWIAGLFAEDGRYQVAALADYFKDRVTAAGEKLGVPPDRRFTGLDGYKQLLQGKVDAVAVETPPCFHPEQAVAAIQAGKHTYIAKPIAVDVPGALAIPAAAAKVKDRLSVLVDFQTRANEFYQGAFEKIKEGLIGKPVCGQAYYYAGRLGVQAKPGSETARLRNWVFDIALSGDIIVEQNIHALDVACWFLQGHPVKAAGTGGRKARTDVGDCWDHFVVTYWYPDDVLLDFSSGQFTQGYDDICCRIYGSLGTVDSHYGGLVNIRAKTGGYRGGQTAAIYKDGAVANIKRFAESLLAAKPIQNIQESAESTLTSILGRTAAYEGRTVTWDEIIKANKKLDAKLNLPADGPETKGN